MLIYVFLSHVYKQPLDSSEIESANSINLVKEHLNKKRNTNNNQNNNHDFNPICKIPQLDFKGHDTFAPGKKK